MNIQKEETVSENNVVGKISGVQLQGHIHIHTLNRGNVV